MAGKVVSDAEMSDEFYCSSSEGSDYENYASQKKNKAVSVAKKVNLLLLN